jgi:hypothetical protein
VPRTKAAKPAAVSAANRLAERSGRNGRKARLKPTKFQASVYAGRLCLGYLRACDDGVEAFNANHVSIGIFSNTKTAAAAIRAPRVGDA